MAGVSAEHTFGRAAGCLAALLLLRSRRWLTKQGSFIRNLKERFATLSMGPLATVVFDYRELETSAKALGSFTLAPTARCSPGDACFPYPAELVVNFVVSDGTCVVLCFDTQAELVSFKDAVAYGLNAKTHLQAVLEKKAEAKKQEEMARMLFEIEEREKRTIIETKIALMQQLTLENDAVNTQFELDRQAFQDSVIQLKLASSAEKQELEEEDQLLRSSLSQELSEAKQAAEDVAQRAKTLHLSNSRASVSLSEMQSSIDNRYVAFRKRENSTTVLRTVDAAELNQRIEAEKLDMLRREQEAIDRDARVVAEKTRRDLEMAIGQRAAAESAAARELHSEMVERSAGDSARRLQTLKDAEMLIAQRAEAARLDAEAREQELQDAMRVRAPKSFDALAYESTVQQRVRNLSTVQASAPTPAHAPSHAEDGFPVAELASPGAVKERVKRLSVVAAAVASFIQPDPASASQVDAEVSVPVKERAKRSSVVAAAVASLSEHDSVASSPAEPAPRRPSVADAQAIPIKERIKRMSVSGSPQLKHSGPVSLSDLLQQDHVPAD